jgi:hypothetical protein
VGFGFEVGVWEGVVKVGEEATQLMGKDGSPSPAAV